MADMPKLKYRIVTGFKPGTSTVVLRPQIVERETCYNDQLPDDDLNCRVGTIHARQFLTFGILTK